MISIVKRLLPIPSYDGYYASQEGKIYSTISKGCRDRHNIDKRTSPKELKPRITKNGYGRVYMRRDDTNIREDVYIHRIIGLLYIPNPNNLPEINHKDCNRLNNNYTNLEWTDRKGNNEYAIKYGYMKKKEKGQFIHK